MKKILYLLFTFAGFAVNAQNYNALNGLYGGELQDMVLSGSTIIGSVYANGIVISTNNGATWTKSNTGITNFYIYDLERDPDTGKIYAVSSTRLFSSSDNGATWIVEASSGFTDAFKIKKTSSFFFMVSRYGGKVYRSANGTTWSQIFTLPTTPEVKDFDANSSGHLLISTWGNYIYRSTNNGLNFDQIGTAQGFDPSNATIYSVAVTGTDVYAVTSSNVYKSTNSGATFSVLVTGPTGLGDSHVETAGGAVFVFGYSTYHISTDAGLTWTAKTHPIAASGFSDATYSALIVSATEAYVSLSDFGTFRTTDGGTTWSERSSGTTGIDYFYPNQFMYAATSNRLLLIKPYTYGLYVSIDDGATWDHLSSTPLNKELQGLKKVGTTIYTYGNGGINRSTDNAVTFSEIWNGQISGCSYYVDALANSDVNTFYSVARGDCSTSDWYLLKSVNGAVTWTKQVITGLPSPSTSYMPDRSFNADASSVYIVLYNYTTGVNREELYKINPTTGVAAQITNVPNTPTMYIQDAKVENNKLYVTTNDAKLHISTDGGTSWTTVNPSQNGTLKIINDNTFYIMNGNGVFLSIDAGATWVNTGSFTNFKAASDVVISTANYAYLTVDYDVVYKSAATVIPPNPPSALSVTGITDTGVGLKWTDNSTNEDYFIIEMKEGVGGTYDSVANWTRSNSAPQTFTHRFINGLTAATNYYFRVRAKGAAGMSGYTNEVSATTQAACAVGATIPDNRSWSVTTASGSAPTVLIQRFPGTDQYFIENVFAGSGNASSFSATFDINCNTDVVVLNNSGCIPNGTGSWNSSTNTLVVKWQSANNVSGTPFSLVSTYTLNASDPTPAAPTSVSAYVKTSSEVVISWLDADYGATYLVERATASGGPFTQVGSIINYGTQTTIENSTYTAGQTYYYRVTARNIGNVASPASTVFSLVYQVPKFEANSLVGYDNSTQGISWIDLENDGDEDLLLTPFNLADGTIGVYENLGNGTFQKITVPGISDFVNPTMRTISVGDINNDGNTDFILSSAGAAGGGHIFMNDGNKVFTRTNVLAGNATNGFNWYSSLTDINGDGKLDPVFTDDVVTAPASTTYKMFTQNVNGGFDPYEIGEIAATTLVSRGGGWADVDNDGDMDFLRTSFGSGATDIDLLFINQGGGVFVKSAASGFESDANLTPRSVSWGDYDNDLDIDVFVGHNGGAPNNMLYMNNGDGTFTRQPASVISEAKTTTTFGSAWGDFDNDGDLDLITGNTGQANLYLNDGTGVFTKHTGSEYLVASDANRTNIAFAASDYDNNGTLDVATGKTVGAGGFPTILLKNNLVVGANTKWLKIKLVGTISNRSGIGARIIITTPDAKKQMRQILAHTGYGSSGSLIAHFGLKNQTSATVEVRWPSGAIQTLTNIAANTLLSVTEDGTGPAILSRTPDVASTNIAANTTISITLNEAAIAQSGKLLMVYRNSDLSTPITGIAVTDATKSGNTYTFTLPTKLAAGTQYNISVDAGAFKDVYGNASLEFPTGLWSFTIATAPVITALSPVNNATSVAINTSLQITFDKPVTAVSGKHLKVLEGATTLVDIDVSANGTITGATYTYTPTSALPNDKQLKVTLDAGAFLDPTKQTEALGISTEWGFTTILAPDTQPPVIVFDNAQIPDPLEKNFSTIQFGIGVTDNRQVMSASMFHRKTGEKDFQETSLTLNTGNGKWEGSVPNSFVSDMGFEYYFEAKDNATPTPKIGRLPAGDTYFKSKTSFKNNPPSIALPSTGTKASWKIISIPYVFENGNNSAATLLSGLGTVDKSKWRLLIYQSTPEMWNENIATIERGKGYFINTAISGAALQLNGAIAPPETRDNLFSIALQAGWNQIGNPYTVAISLSDVKNFNPGLATAQFVTFANGSYSPATQLAPFEGGFVNVPTATTIKVPFSGQTISGGRKQSGDLSVNIDDPEWLVRIKLAQGSSTFELGYIGMAQDANVAIDGYDMVRPPRFFDFIDMSVSHPEHVSKKFSGDVVPVNDSHVWDFTVDSNQEGVAEMSWQNLNFENAAKELFLLDVSRQIVVDMRKVGSYTFSPKESASFKMFFGENLKIAPEKIVLGNAFPNPTSGLTTVGFSLPDNGGQDQFVSLDLIDPMGRNIGSVVQGRFKPGFNQARFEANALPNGFYTYRLTVQNAKGTSTLVSKLIIK